MSAWDWNRLARWYATPEGRVVAAQVVEGLRALPSVPWVGSLKPSVLMVGYGEPFTAVWPTAAVEDSGTAFLAATAEQIECRYDRILLTHGLELAESPHAVLAKCWAALRPDGVLVVAVPNRMSLWRWKRSTPLSAGVSFGFGEIQDLLLEEGFKPLERGYAVACPLGGAVGDTLCPNFGGLVLMTARKDVLGMRALRRDVKTGAVGVVPVGVATLRGN